VSILLYRLPAFWGLKVVNSLELASVAFIGQETLH